MNTHHFIAKWLVNHQTPKAVVPKVDETKTYTEEDIVALLKQLPDAYRFPLPEGWYEKYGLPEKPEPMTMNEVLKNSFKTMFGPSYGEVEVREPAPGGVRKLPIVSFNTVEDVIEATKAHSQPEPIQEVEGTVE